MTWALPQNPQRSANSEAGDGILRQTRRGWGSHSTDQSSARAVPHVESPKKIGHTMLEHGKHIDDITFDITKYFGRDGTAILGMVSDMIKAYADLHTFINKSLFMMHECFKARKWPAIAVCLYLQSTISKECNEAGLNDVSSKLERLRNDIVGNLIDSSTVESTLFHIMNTALDHSRKLMLFHVDSAHIDKYNNDELFGSEVNLIFPGAAQDIKEAGNCYALGQPTACVLHLMRALESSLNTLAQVVPGFKLGTKDTMGAIVKQLRSLLLNIPDKTVIDNELHRKISEAALHFNDIIKSTRNKAMHSGSFYSMEQASSALESAKWFMIDVANIIKLYEEKRISTTALMTN